MTPSDTTFSVEVGQLTAAAGCLADEAGILSGINLDAPDPTIYGTLVGSAASDAEPATTDDINALIGSLATAVGALGDRVERTCGAYTAVEDGNAVLGGMIGGGAGGVG